MGNFTTSFARLLLHQKFLIKEIAVDVYREHDFLYTNKTNTLFGGLISAFSIRVIAGFRLFNNLFFPKMSPDISNAFIHINKQAKLSIENTDINNKENDL